MKQVMDLKPSQKLGLEMLIKERRRLEEAEAMFIGTCLLDLGETIDGQWKWDWKDRQFWREVDDSGK